MPSLGREMGVEDEDPRLLLLDHHIVHSSGHDLVYHCRTDHLVWLVEDIVLVEQSLGNWKLGWYGVENRGEADQDEYLVAPKLVPKAEGVPEESRLIAWWTENA